MPLEIERKFLVYPDLVPEPSSSIRMVQAYLCADAKRTVRVRVAGDKAFLTVKSGLTGISRDEFEYEIPVDDALGMMKLSVDSPVEKVRKIIYAEGKKWEVDFFSGANQGLVVAEVELGSADEEVTLPDWIREEVTGDLRYQNSQLAKFPYSLWT